MKKWSSEIEIDAPIDKVWALFDGSLKDMQKIMPQVIANDPIEQKEEGVGSIHLQKFQEGKQVMEYMVETLEYVDNQNEKKKNENFVEENLNDICASIQQRIVSILLNKLKKASAQTGIKNICIAGGVSANRGLRRSLEEMGKQSGWKTFIPHFEYCTDNAAMIAITAYHKYLAADFADLSISPTAKGEW